ncbi:hypothetical protein B0H13DRAFT_875424 [Mycena leptocephala]|nr:hypothetical protein B0H13DRAFT_875424 [Mycena leptocephala]
MQFSQRFCSSNIPYRRPGRVRHSSCSSGNIMFDSRPEAHIRDILAEPSFHRLLDSVNIRQSFLDIETYFCDEFSRIHREHRETMSRVTTPWPPPEILNDLVEKSSGYFIYAATVIKFVDDKFSRPTERLAAVQNLTPTDSDAPFATLDQLYIQILSGVPTRFRSKLGDILHCTELHVQLKLHQIERLLELQPGDVRLILRSLHSVLKIDSDNISVHHASFLDFLRDQQQSMIFHIDLENRMNVARAVLKIFSEDSHRLDTPDDPLIWRFDTKQFISFIVSLPPLAELVPHMRLFNPDFLWWHHFESGINDKINDVLRWLKTIRPMPEDLIQHWECYHFIFVWENSH